MKVTRDKEGFAPITIVIETEEEAEALWHKLFFPTPRLQAEHKQCSLDRRLEDYMWRVFKEVYKTMCKEHGRDDC